MRKPLARQQGVFLLEALIAILVFSLGILGMMGIAGLSVSSQSDAQYRTEAANAADQVASIIALKVNRVPPLPPAIPIPVGTQLAPFASQPSGDPASCSFSGGATTDTDILAVFAATNLPGADATKQQVVIDTATFNRVTVTFCWKAGTDAAWRHHTLVSYVN